MYIKEYGKEFKIKNQILLFIAALLIGTAVYYLLPTGKQYAEKIYHVNIYVYLTTTSLFLIIYNLKIVEEKLNEKLLKLIRYISNNTLVIYLLASITDMMVYARLKEILPDVTTRLRYAIPTSILIFVVTLVMSYIYNLILKAVKQVITGRNVEKI
jgi:putative membrane protein